VESLVTFCISNKLLETFKDANLELQPKLNLVMEGRKKGSVPSMKVEFDRNVSDEYKDI
jgi:hypothetical protein